MSTSWKFSSLTYHYLLVTNHLLLQFLRKDMSVILSLWTKLAALFKRQPRQSTLTYDAGIDIDWALLALKRHEETEQTSSSIILAEKVLSVIIMSCNETFPCISRWEPLVADFKGLRALLADHITSLESVAAKKIGPSEQIHLGVKRFFPTLAHVASALRNCITSRRSHRLWLIFCLHARGLKKNTEKYRQDVVELSRILRETLPEVICNVSVDDLSTDVPLDISTTATPRRYRLVDCKQLTENYILSISEFKDFPRVGYSAISYVWRHPYEFAKDSNREFSVKGAEDGDPINVDVLRHACAASLKRDFAYLWLDRLCIMQTRTDDRNWQIKQMYHMYLYCDLCIVLAGGLQHLPVVSEETVWIHRGWTLQEVVAPQTVTVLFAWKLGPGVGQAGGDDPQPVLDVVPGQSAAASLSLILSACTTGSLSFTGDQLPGRPSVMVEAKMFMNLPPNYSWNDAPFWRPTRRILPPNVAALTIAMDPETDEDMRYHAIWQSALVRTSSRPVDMVFSIMGLFGVSLEPSEFKDTRDRLRPTIALARKILEKGGRATWLGIAFKLDPCAQLSTFPVFPQTSVSGKALIRTREGGIREVSQLVDSEYPYAGALVPMPQGSMDEDGYLSFRAKAVPLVRAEAGTKLVDSDPMPSVIVAQDKTLWRVHRVDEGSWKPATYAVLLGWFNGYFPGHTPAEDAKNVRAMLLEEHAPMRFHLRSYFLLSMKCRAWVMSWEAHRFSVGGPQALDSRSSDDEVIDATQEVSAPDMEMFRTAPNFSPRGPVSLRDHTARKARWAVPQSVLERSFQAKVAGQDADVVLN